MKKQLLTLVLALLPALAWAAESDWPMASMSPDHRDKASLQRGAQAYMNYCFGCHSLEHSRYQQVADDLEIPHDLYMENLVFDAEHEIGDLMDNAMRRDDGEAWFGVAPLDLTMVARVRGAEWVYNYLLTFYKDDTRPFGVNNAVFSNAAMPHVLVDLQGLQECVPGDDGGCSELVLIEEGELSPEEYDQLAYDLANFLDYTAEPMKLDRQRIGVYVLLFMALFFVFAYLLSREYWKDVH